MRNVRKLFYGGIAMKKNVKQLLVNAMEEYGNTLILSDRFWSQTQKAPRGRKIKIYSKKRLKMENKMTQEEMCSSVEAYRKLLSWMRSWLTTPNFGGNTMTMKKNLIRAMQTIGQMRAVIGE